MRKSYGRNVVAVDRNGKRKLISRAVAGVGVQNRFEPLEQRVLMCASTAELVAAGIPESIIHDDGHISQSDFDLLSEKQQAHVNPHLIEADLDGPIDYDKLLGLPLHSSGEVNSGVNLAPDALPDFFPLMYQVNSNLDLTSQQGRALLKFGTQVNNQGNGPASLISGRPGVDSIPTGAPITSWVNPDGSQNVLQAVYTYTGSTYTLSYYRAAGQFTYHTGHGHFHFDGYADYKLRVRNTNGTPGAYVQRADGSGVVGSKTGFCLLTFSGTFTTEGGQSSSSIPGFGQDTGVPSSCGLQQGVRTGRYDQYSSGLEGQWIDVAGVAPGNYFLEISLDASDAILESNEANNAKTFAVTIPNYTTGSPIVPDNFDTGTHNDTFAAAADMGVMGTTVLSSLTIDWGQDQDYFKFAASSSGNYTVTSTQANGNVDLSLYDANQTQIGASTNPSGNESISYNFVKGQTYFLKANSYNSTTSNNYQVAWNLKPTVDDSSPARTVAEENSNGIYFTVARNGPKTSSLVVKLSISGNGIPGVDYIALPSQVTIDVESSEVKIPLIPIDNFVPNSKRTVTVNVLSDAAYVIGTNGATITIVDADAGSAVGGRADGSRSLSAFASSAGLLPARRFSDTAILLGDDRTSSFALVDELL